MGLNKTVRTIKMQAYGCTKTGFLFSFNVRLERYTLSIPVKITTLLALFTTSSQEPFPGIKGTPIILQVNPWKGRAEEP